MSAGVCEAGKIRPLGGIRPDTLTVEAVTYDQSLGTRPTGRQVTRSQCMKARIRGGQKSSAQLRARTGFGGSAASSARNTEHGSNWSATPCNDTPMSPGVAAND